VLTSSGLGKPALEPAHEDHAANRKTMRYRPEKITTLFVGESAPDGGMFFYLGNSQLLRNMRSIVEQVLGETDDFLATFKAYGWCLDPGFLHQPRSGRFSTTVLMSQ
jgi:hypothetical protein